MSPNSAKGDQVDKKDSTKHLTCLGMTEAYHRVIILAANVVIAVSYGTLTYQLYCCVRSSQLTTLLEALRRSSDVNKNNLFMMIIALTVLFASFIALCGFTHAFAAASHFLPTAEFIHVTFLIVLVMCAVVSMATAVAGHQLFPLILNVLSKYELNSEGNLQHVENYLIEVVELVKESVVVFSEQLKILRCNEASKVLFGSASLVHERVTKFIHPDDIKAFEKAVQQAMLTYDQTPVTVEYRVRSSKSSAAAGPSPVVPLQAKRPAVLRSAPSLRWSGSASTAKIFATIAEDPQDTSAVTQFPVLSNETSFAASGSFSVSDIGSNDALTADDFTWVESTMCKGMRFSSSEEFEYDVKMVTRNIEDRRKQALEQYENILRATEEEARINAAKLRYISCIAHDLKTPLQSFCFSLDLLAQSPLHPEQREFIEQANVAVDLMKLTISQTMDISKALTGAKLQPRRTTVCLSSVLHRVKVIINGYGKQVPIIFEVAPDVCDAVITDEEWLWQMLLNLLTNACKYTDKGSIQVKIRNTSEISLPGTRAAAAGSPVHLCVTRECLLFEVIDTGVGVSGDKIDHMFEAFAQVQEGQVTGTGLGLFGVRTRAEGLHGTCGARHNTASPTGTGTVIWFAIPYVPDPHSRSLSIASVSSDHSDVPTLDLAALEAAANAKPVQSAKPPAPSLHHSNTGLFSSRQLTAMVINDTLTVRKLMERLLLKMGFARVDCYENGSKGLDAMMAGQVDIVFSDVQMPIMTGPEMVRRFREWECNALQRGDRTQKQLVIAVTANGAQLGSGSGGGGGGGFDLICPKPLGVQDIQRVVQEQFLLKE